MSSFVRIGTSPGEIIGIASRISARGDDLTAAVTAHNQAIVEHENHPKTFPSDQFTDGFTKEYEKPVDASDGNTHPANEAVRQGAAYCGRKLTEIGEFVNRAMVNYEVTDQQSGADIARTDV
ncbi:hypothetical protein [Actinoplanes sp. DH11]|uniref:hypothetical protein n=1 Tax=Actinoplanes sp. DH11 TaxID=2857011 RepID=UPI001E419964|nr:hypothetical protein [Actinoplanes sp. DH11]